MAWILIDTRIWVARFRPKHSGKAEEDMEDRSLSVDEICEYLGMSQDTIYKWIDEQDLPVYPLACSGSLERKRLMNW